MYPIAYSSPATVVIITDVLFVICASWVVISIFSSPFFSSMPNSSINAPLVPEPSSRDTIVMSLELSQSVCTVFVSAAASALLSSDALFPQPVAAIVNILIIDKTAINFFILILQISFTSGYWADRCRPWFFIAIFSSQLSS